MKSLFIVDEKYHGRGRVSTAWQRDGNFLATCGVTGLVHIFDRQGDEVDEIELEKGGRVILDWDFEGENLAILQENSKHVIIWNLSSRRSHSVDTGFKDPSFLQWSKSGAQVAIGTCSGNLILYCLDSRRKVPVLGKHTGTVVCGAWNRQNFLALCSQDKTLTVSKASGETVHQLNLGGVPYSVQFGEVDDSDRNEGASKTCEEKNTNNSLIAVNIDRERVVIFDIEGEDDPIELTFDKRYGRIKRFVWFREGFVVAGFSAGHVAIISTDPKKSKKKKELYSWQLFDESLRDLKYCKKLNKIACLGDDCIKMIECVGEGYWRLVRNEIVRIDTRREKPTSISWSLDGQILTVGTSIGRVHNFVANIPLMHDSSGSRMAYLSSLQEATILDFATEARGARGQKIELEVEPAFVSLGSTHFAAGMNNRVWYYRNVDNDDEWSPCGEREYLGSVERVRLSKNIAAVLCNGRVHVHSLNRGKDDRSSMLPEDNDRATCAELTDDLLIYGTESGHLKYFSLGDWAALSGCDIRHTCEIRHIFPNKNGTRTIFVDERGDGFMHNAAESIVVAISDITSTNVNVHWDQSDWGTFVITKESKIMPYVLETQHINGPQIRRLGVMSIDKNGETKIESVASSTPEGYTSVLVYNGVAVGQLKNGALSRLVLKTHDQLQGKVSSLKDYFSQTLLLGRFDDAWQAALKLNKRAYWLAYCARTMESVEIRRAMNGYRKLGDAGMVLALESLLQIEDRNLLSGHVCVLFSEFGQAQELFLRSSNAAAALEMRKDLLQWDHAIKLAKTIAPEQVPFISIEYAQQLEVKGEISAALGMYKSARDSEHVLEADSVARCRAGIARTTIRLGDVRRGKQLAIELRSRDVFCQCGEVLEGMNQLDEAAQFYELGKDFEKAASIYIAAKHFEKASPLMNAIRSTKLHAQYAKAKRAQKQYAAAAEAYKRAQDMDSVVEMYLNHLGQPEKAMAIVRSTHSARAAEMMAEYCKTTGNHSQAIEFLLMAKRQSEAFELAKTYDGMDMYVKKLGNDGTPDNYMQIARYYEQKRDWGKAGYFYSVCCQYHKALNFYLMCGERFVDKAIDLVGKARSDILTHTLIDFLMGETDGIPKDPNYVYQLYMALGNFLQAAKTAVIISRQEQELGNYRDAHKVLYETQRELLEKRMEVPKTLRNAFMLLHSYLIVKQMAKKGNHLNAAHMLIRVANSISKFPCHKVEILTSCVIECKRAGLKSMAFKYASKLMEPQYREKIPEKFKRKIESIIRKHRKTEPEDDIEKTPSPYAPDHVVSVTDLVCPVTKNDLPWCIVTGYHMTLTDWCVCPNSRLPALFSKYKDFIDNGGDRDPVTNMPVRLADLEIVDDPSEYLKTGSSAMVELEKPEEKREAGDRAAKTTN
eukprot:g948.t1